MWLCERVISQASLNLVWRFFKLYKYLYLTYRFIIELFFDWKIKIKRFAKLNWKRNWLFVASIIFTRFWLLIQAKNKFRSNDWHFTSVKNNSHGQVYELVFDFWYLVRLWVKWRNNSLIVEQNFLIMLKEVKFRKLMAVTNGIQWNSITHLANSG